MARTFDSSAKFLQNTAFPWIAPSGGGTQGAVSCWVRPHWNGNDGVVHAIWYFGAGTWDMPGFHKATDNNYYMGFVPGGERRIIASAASLFVANTWAHHYFDWAEDGVQSVDATTCERYFVNGVLVGARASAAGLNLGGGHGHGLRIGGGGTNSDMDFAEMAAWTGRRLTNFEIGLLARGYSPAYFPTRRVFYHRVLGEQSPEFDYQGSPLHALTVNGSAAAFAHPDIQLPTATQKMWAGWRPIGAGFGNARKHRGDVRLNRASPLATKIVSCFPCHEGKGTPRDLVRGGVRVNAVAGAWYQDRFGKNVRSWQITRQSTTDHDFASGPWSIAAFGRLYNLPAGSNYTNFLERYAYVSEGSNQGWMLTVYGPSSGTGASRFNFVSMNNNGLTTYRLPGTTPVAVGDWLIVGTSDGVTRRLYVNGLEEASTTNNPNPAAVPGGVGLATSQSDGNSIHYWYAAWRRCLLPSEVRLLWRKKTTIGGLIEHPLVLAPAAPRRYSTMPLTLSIGRKAPWL